MERPRAVGSITVDDQQSRSTRGHALALDSSQPAARMLSYILQHREATAPLSRATADADASITIATHWYRTSCYLQSRHYRYSVHDDQDLHHDFSTICFCHIASPRISSHAPHLSACERCAKVGAAFTATRALRQKRRISREICRREHSRCRGSERLTAHALSPSRRSRMHPRFR